MRSVADIAKAYFKSVGMDLVFQTVKSGSGTVWLCIADLIPSPNRIFTVSEPMRRHDGWAGYLIDMRRGFVPDKYFESGSVHGIPGECGQTQCFAADRLMSRIRSFGWEVTEYSGYSKRQTDSSSCGCDCDGKCESCYAGRKKERTFRMPSFSSYEELDLKLSASGY